MQQLLVGIEVLPAIMLVVSLPHSQSDFIPQLRPCKGFTLFREKSLFGRIIDAAESIIDCSPARPGGLLSAPPCSPSPTPPKSAPGGCLSESIIDCSPARPGGLLSAPPCSPSPAPPKSAPGGCLSESLTDCSPARPGGLLPRSAPPPHSVLTVTIPGPARPTRRRAAAFPSLLLTAVRHAPAVCCQPRRAHHPRPGAGNSAGQPALPRHRSNSRQLSS